MPGRGSDASADWLGIDFGTCYSSAARLVDGKPVAVREPHGRGDSVPSSVLLAVSNGKEELVVGVAAENQKLFQPERFKSEFKRDLGKQQPYLLGNRQVPVEELVAEILAFLREQAEKAAAREVRNAVVTIPVSYEQTKQELIRAAARKAGFERVELLLEPVAALIDYAFDANGAGTTHDGLILVYDLGGGTFDCALVRFTGGVHEVLKYGGDKDVGGANFDHAIEHDLARTNDVVTRSLDDLDSDVEAERIQALGAEHMAREACRKLKHDLSGAPQAAMSLVLPAGPVYYELTRQQLAELIDADVQRTIQVCREVLKAAGHEWKDVDGVLLVGGSSKMPFIEEALAQESGRPILHTDDPELTVCEGAALRAAELATPLVRDLVVDASGGGDHKSIAAAVKEAQPGAKITVMPGPYEETVTVDKEVEITGEGFRSKIIVYGQKGPALRLKADGAKVSGLSLSTAKKRVVDVADGVRCAVENCEITILEGDGVHVGKGAECSLRGNHFFDPAVLRSAAADGEKTPIRLYTWGVRLEPGAQASLEHNHFEGMDKQGITLKGAGTTLACRGDRFETMDSAVLVADAATSTLERCEIAGTRFAAVCAGGKGTHLTMQGTNVREMLDGDGVSVETGAEGVIEHCDIGGLPEYSAVICADGSRVTIERSRLHHSSFGVSVTKDAGGRIEDCDIWDNEIAGIAVGGKGASVQAIRNDILHGQIGVLVEAGAEALVTANEMSDQSGSGVQIAGQGATAYVRENRISGSAAAGVLFGDGSAGSVERNDISGCAMAGVDVHGSAASIRDNKLHENQTGVSAHTGASGPVEGNEIWANMYGIELNEAAAPTVRDNTIKQNAHSGMRLNQSGGTVVDNRIIDNGGPGISFFAPPSEAATRVTGNRLRDNKSGALFGIAVAAGWGLGKNDLGLVRSTASELKGVARHIEAGDIGAADNACKELIRKSSGVNRIISMELAVKIKADLLKQMNALWLEATGRGLRSRTWVVTDSDITTTAFVNTYLEKRLKNMGL